MSDDKKINHIYLSDLIDDSQSADDIENKSNVDNNDSKRKQYIRNQICEIMHDYNPHQYSPHKLYMTKDIKRDINNINKIMSDIQQLRSFKRIFKKISRDQDYVIYGSVLAYAVLSDGDTNMFFNVLAENKSDIDILVNYNFKSEYVFLKDKKETKHSYEWNLKAREMLINDKLTSIRETILPQLTNDEFKIAINKLSEFFNNTKRIHIVYGTTKLLTNDKKIKIPVEIHAANEEHPTHPAHMLKYHLNPFFTATSLMYVKDVGIQLRTNIPIQTIIEHIKQKKLVTVNNCQLTEATRKIFIMRVIKYLKRGWTLELPNDEHEKVIINWIEMEYMSYLMDIHNDEDVFPPDTVTNILTSKLTEQMMQEQVKILQEDYEDYGKYMKYVTNVTIIHKYIVNYIRQSADMFIQCKDVSNIVAEYSAMYCSKCIYEEYEREEISKYNQRLQDKKNEMTRLMQSGADIDDPRVIRLKLLHIIKPDTRRLFLTSTYCLDAPFSRWL